MKNKLLNFFLIIIFIIFFIHLLKDITQDILKIKTPFMFFRYNLGFLFPSSYINTGSSYPSGHSLRIMFISVIIIYLIKKSKLQLINKLIFYSTILLFAGFMLVSRISLGEHWPTDVIGRAGVNIRRRK